MSLGDGGGGNGGGGGLMEVAELEVKAGGGELEVGS